MDIHCGAGAKIDTLQVAVVHSSPTTRLVHADGEQSASGVQSCSGFPAVIGRSLFGPVAARKGGTRRTISSYVYGFWSSSARQARLVSG